MVAMNGDWFSMYEEIGGETQLSILKKKKKKALGRW